MPKYFHIAILSDIHYAGALERACGNNYEYRSLQNPLFRRAVQMYRHFIWLRHPLSQNHLLDTFLAESGSCDFVIANGDYCCNTAYFGVSEDAACQSASECLTKLRGKFPNRFQATFGDHELGKISMFTGSGGMRLASWRRAVDELNLQPCWRVELGNYVLIGVVSSLVALPVFEADTLPEERPEWRNLRTEHLEKIRQVFSELKSNQRVLLFCHDPTALPFLGGEEIIRQKLSQIEQTVIGHLHSNLVFWKSSLLAGMPTIRFLGNGVEKISSAVRQAREWRPFRVRLCPSLAGIELLKDGGYYTVRLDSAAIKPARFEFHKIKR